MQITMRQLQATLRDLGLFNMALAEAERDADLMAKWRKPATVIDRSDPEVERLRRHFGAPSGNIDLLFKKAAQKPGGPPSGALSVVRETEPPWLTLARSYLGTKEVPGRGSNGTIDGFFRDAGYPGYRDETSWCAAFVGAVLARSGYPRLADLTARSGRYYGQKLDGPKIGCVVVFWRESPTSWKGHIGFVTGIDWDKKTLRVLGGNQNDAVTEATFAMSKVLAYRWPVAATVKALKSAGSTEARLLDAAKKIVLSTGVIAVGAETSAQLPSVVPSIFTQFETLSAVLTQINTIMALIADNKWLILTAVAALLYLLVRTWQANRLERAQRGYPILAQDIEVDGGTDAV
ncbi:MAG: hypothetical protein B7Y80_20575 [Hyphomicrobium sp. 32-62-53]|nr:MAG: hypothetical protein B7Z29_20450 [Hyphomicrobium sp. 12-62-95]OYX97181.1 MAG: hypothetical protein B7Y80_20575 [Hyphomicrobium sp. 32-62-53]